jgi:glutamate-ammonia-ligase adenylyltransferase
MALTRARPVFGSAAVRAKLQAIIDEMLHRERDAAKLLADAVKMRGDIATHKPPASIWDVKLVEGGLIDLEFCLHVTQLRYRTGLSPRLGEAVERLVADGRLSAALVPAHALLSRLLVTLRLVAPGSDEPPMLARALVAQACAQPDWPALVEAYASARQSVREAWSAIAAEAQD